MALAARAISQGALRPVTAAAGPTGEAGYVLAVIGAMLLYALVLVGHGLPFWLATAGFVTLFIYFFDRARQTALGRPLARQWMLAAICGIATSAIVTLVFQNIFYVRLP